MGNSEEKSDRSERENPNSTELVRRLVAEEIVDAFLAYPLARVIDLSKIRELILGGLSSSGLEHIHAVYISGGVEDFLQTLVSREEKVGDFYPLRVQKRISEIMTSAFPQFSWLRGMTDIRLLNQLLVPVFHNMFLQYTARIGLFETDRKQIGKRVVAKIGRDVTKTAGRRLASFGKSLMDGVGIDYREKLQSLRGDLTQDMAGLFKQSLNEHCQSPEGKRSIEALKQRALEHFWQLPIRDFSDDFFRIRLKELLNEVPETLSHMARQSYFSQLLEQRLSTVWPLLREKSLGELLNDVGLLQPMRSLSIDVVEVLLKDMVEKKAFREWVQREVIEKT